jgi:preprotein translocase subunit SecB
MQLSQSPITLLSQEFLHVELSAIPVGEFGPGNIDVERSVYYDKEDDDWRVTLTVQIIGVEGKEEPPYKGALVARGFYKVHESYPHDVEKLVRITGASMLYGAIREMVAYISSRNPNGMINLPSVSFMENEEKPKAKKKTVKKKAAGKK